MVINTVTIIGHLGKDVELKYLPSGSALANFSVAVNERWTDKETGEKQERVHWFNCVAFGRLAEFCQEYLKKGSKACVSGKLCYREWEDEYGKKSAIEIRVREIELLGDRDGRPKSQSEDNGDEDVPF